MESRTSLVGMKTQGRLTRTSVTGKDARFDYCFKRKEDVNSGHAGQEGWEVVKGNSRDKEAWMNPYSKSEKTTGKNQLALGDTVLCKRTKEASEHFNYYNNTVKRNAQNRLIKEATGQAKRQMRQGGVDGNITGGATIKGGNFTQVAGPNQDHLNINTAGSEANNG